LVHTHLVMGWKELIIDVSMNKDNAHRGADQIMPPTHTSYASELTVSPILSDPVYLDKL